MWRFFYSLYKANPGSHKMAYSVTKIMEYRKLTIKPAVKLIENPEEYK